MQTVNAVLKSFENIPVSCQFPRAMFCFSKYRASKNDWGYRFNQEHFSLVSELHTLQIWPEFLWFSSTCVDKQHDDTW